MRQELSPAGLILWKRSGCDDRPWLFLAVNIEPSSSRRVCAPSNPSCRVFSSSLHHSSLCRFQRPVQLSRLHSFFSPPLCLLLSLSNRLLDAIVGPPSPPLSSATSLLRHLSVSDLSTSHSLDTPFESDFWLIMKIRRIVYFLWQRAGPKDGTILVKVFPYYSLAYYERVGASGTVVLLCVGTHTLVSIIITGSRCLGHGCDIRAPCACLRWGGCSSPQQKD